MLIFCRSFPNSRLQTSDGVELETTTTHYLEALELEIEWGRYKLGIEIVNRGAPIEINGTLSAVKTVGSLMFGFLNASRKAFKRKLSGN